MLYDSNTKLYDYYVEISPNLYYDIIVFCTKHVTKNDDNSFDIKGIHMYVNNQLEKININY